MNKKLNELLNAEILKKLPKNLKPVEYLVDKLAISKESAYRRMRGEIPFTLEEINFLSHDLDISVDEVIGISKNNRVFFDTMANPLNKAEESFLYMLQDYYKLAESVYRATEKDIIISINRLTPCLLLRYNSLFKLLYYRWIHQTANVCINHSFSSTDISSEILNVRDKYRQLSHLAKTVNFIVDKDLFLSTVREIQYYCGRKLISEKEVLMLKHDLLRLLSDIEQVMQNGCNKSGCKYNFYLAMLNVETNTASISFDSNIASHFWLYPVSPVIINGQKVCEAHRKWLESLKKSSVLITQSNEMLQTKFIEKQRKYIESITDDLICYE
jgi:hypothetical protein